MSDSKPTVGTGKPMWEPKVGDKVELLGSVLPREVGTVLEISTNQPYIVVGWGCHGLSLQLAAELTWHNPEAT